MTSQIPDDFIVPSKKEKLLRNIDRRDKAFRAFEALVLAMLIGITILSLYRVNDLAISTQANITEHRKQIEGINKEGSAQLNTAAAANRTRLDVDLCIVSVPPQTRTPEYVKACYDDAEKANGVKIKRFGYGQ